MRRKLFDDDDRETTADAIRQLFQEMGGNVPVRVLAGEAIQRGIVPFAILEQCQRRGVQEICRDALSTDTPERIPLAQPTGGGSDDPWLLLDLFDYACAESLIERRAKGVIDDYSKLLRLHQWCARKFGKAPEIPQLIELNEA